MHDHENEHTHEHMHEPVHEPVREQCAAKLEELKADISTQSRAIVLEQFLRAKNQQLASNARQMLIKLATASGPELATWMYTFNMLGHVTESKIVARLMLTLPRAYEVATAINALQDPSLRAGIMALVQMLDDAEAGEAATIFLMRLVSPILEAREACTRILRLFETGQEHLARNLISTKRAIEREGFLAMIDTFGVGSDDERRFAQVAIEIMSGFDASTISGITRLAALTRSPGRDFETTQYMHLVINAETRHIALTFLSRLRGTEDLRAALSYLADRSILPIAELLAKFLVLGCDSEAFTYWAIMAASPSGRGVVAKVYDNLSGIEVGRRLLASPTSDVRPAHLVVLAEMFDDPAQTDGASLLAEMLLNKADTTAMNAAHIILNTKRAGSIEDKRTAERLLDMMVACTARGACTTHLLPARTDAERTAAVLPTTCIAEVALALTKLPLASAAILLDMFTDGNNLHASGVIQNWLTGGCSDEFRLVAEMAARLRRRDPEARDILRMWNDPQWDAPLRTHAGTRTGTRTAWIDPSMWNDSAGPLTAPG